MSQLDNATNTQKRDFPKIIFQTHCQFKIPQYFLDYQEDRVMIGVTRWKDRIVSSSGDWSGNLFDFTFKVLPKLQSDLKIPFVLRGNQRVDDTPMHKLLREAVVNTLSNADYWGRRGVVISKNKDGFTFANPGGMRVSKKEAIEGGVSDPRNSTILKIFSLIRFGERAGSGLNGIMHVWNKVYHTEANIGETSDTVECTVLNLPFNGNTQDVDAMLEFYDNPEELTFNTDTNNLNTDTNNTNTDINTDTNNTNSDTNNTNSDTNNPNTDTTLTLKQKKVLEFCVIPHRSREILKEIDVAYHSRNIKKYITDLVAIGQLVMSNPDKPKDPNQKYQTKM